MDSKQNTTLNVINIFEKTNLIIFRAKILSAGDKPKNVYEDFENSIDIAEEKFRKKLSSYEIKTNHSSFDITKSEGLSIVSTDI